MTKNLVLLAVTMVALWGLFIRPDQMRHACFDQGRKVGGAEQRIFNDRANGDEPMRKDVAIASGPSKDCR